MNWLAHLYLSEPTAAYRIGNLLPDILPAAELRAMPAEFAAGIRCHRLIDAFTDAHPVVRGSIARLGPEYRRVGGIVVDVFYDHFLAADWEKYSAVRLEDFAGEFYRSVEMLGDRLSANTLAGFRRMSTENWLCSYREVEGVHIALQRIERRMRRPVKLAAAAEFLRTDHENLRDDFREFFPALIGHLEASGAIAAVPGAR